MQIQEENTSAFKGCGISQSPKNFDLKIKDNSPFEAEIDQTNVTSHRSNQGAQDTANDAKDEESHEYFEEIKNAKHEETHSELEDDFFT
jgi:hypothetical protein